MLRMIEIILPIIKGPEVRDLLKDLKIIGMWRENLVDDLILIKILLDVEESERVIDLLEKNFSYVPNFRLILTAVEAVVPRPPEKEEKTTKGLKPAIIEEIEKGPVISQEELYSDLLDSIKVTKVYFFMVILSTIVAAAGIRNGNVAVIIGAMVIAPLIGPHMALSFATTLADGKLARKALRVALLGILPSLGLSIAIGFFFGVNDPLLNNEILIRTELYFSDVIVAIASGSAAALAFTAGLSTIIIGVMVAVALLPPLVTFGLLFGAGYTDLAFRALLVFVANVICINLSGVFTFYTQGVQPRTWLKAAQAQRATEVSMSVWLILLVILIIIIAITTYG